MLSERIASALDKLHLSEVTIVIEATSIYGDTLIYTLRGDGSPGRYLRHIHVLNPKQVRKFNDAYSDLPKNDYVDVFVIADHLRFDRIASDIYMDHYYYKFPQSLTKARLEAIQNFTRAKQRFATICS